MTDSLTESLPDLTRDWTQPYTLPSSIAYKTSSIYAFIALLPPSRRQARWAQRAPLSVWSTSVSPGLITEPSPVVGNPENTRVAVDENLFQNLFIGNKNLDVCTSQCTREIETQSVSTQVLSDDDRNLKRKSTGNHGSPEQMTWLSVGGVVRPGQMLKEDHVHWEEEGGWGKWTRALRHRERKGALVG